MGTAVGRIATAGMKSFLSRARNSGRGSSLSMCSMSRWEYSGIGTSHPRPQLVQRAELQLLDGALALAEACRDVADAALVDEALDDDVALVPRELVDQSEQPRALFGALAARRARGPVFALHARRAGAVGGGAPAPVRARGPWRARASQPGPRAARRRRRRRVRSVRRQGLGHVRASGYRLPRPASGVSA